MKFDRNQVVSHDSDALLGDVLNIFTLSNTYRNASGVTPSLQKGFLRQTIVDNNNENMTEFVRLNINTEPGCGCDASKHESCPTCETDLIDVCSTDEMQAMMGSQSTYKGMANLLATVKKYEYFSLIENAYAQIGNKPFKLKANRSPDISEQEKEDAANDFFQYLEAYLADNHVRVHEIPEAFNLSTLTEVSESLETAVKAESKRRLLESVEVEEAVLERVFKRANLMKEYIEVKKDTADYPIGVLWADDVALKREKYVDNGVLKIRKTIQCDAERVDPCYFWATEDQTLHRAGTAVFRLKQYTSGDLLKWASDMNKGVEQFVEDYPDGLRNEETALFSNHSVLRRGIYDILVCRGWFPKEHVTPLNIDIPKEYDSENYVPCEIHFVKRQLLKVRVMEMVDETLGVYTTVFRRNGQSIFGYSLHEFIHPFAKMYEAMIDAIDKNMANSTSSIIQIDRGVVADPEKYLTRNAKTGEMELDFSEDWVVEFDSSDVFNPNFRGFPIHVDQLPSNLSKLLPLRDFVIRELELLSGIPSILVNSNNISSALRTTENFNAAFTASAKVIQALLRESEERILKPVIQFFFDVKARKGEMKQFLIDAEPEILLSDTLTRENNEGQELLRGVQTLAQLGGSMIPQEKLAALLNQVGRQVYNLEEDLIPGVSPLATTTSSVETQSV